ncbi:MAG: hypothetical protein KAX65_00170 [Caldilineaceae bacterium]|nr:hypothetical protein [Caldilineaceae bacterium]
MAQPNDAGIGGGQLSAAERARREALRQSLLANAAKYAPAPTPRPKTSATSSAAYDPLSSANTGKPVARKVGATIAPAPEEIVRQRRPAPAPVAPPKPSIPTVTARPSATTSQAYDPLSSANTGRRYTPPAPPEPPAAPPRLDIPSRGYSFTDGSYTGATPQQRAQEIDWAQMAAQATAQANAQRRQAEAQAPAQGFAGNGQVPFGMIPSPVVPMAGALALVPPAVNTLFRAVDAARQAENPEADNSFNWGAALTSSPLTPALPDSAEGEVQYIADRALTRTEPGGDAWINYSRQADAERKRAEEAANYAAGMPTTPWEAEQYAQAPSTVVGGLPSTYMPYTEEELRAMEGRQDVFNPVFANASRFFDATLHGVEKAIATLRVPGSERTDAQGNPIPDTGLNVGAGFGVTMQALLNAAVIGTAGRNLVNQARFGYNPATIRSAEQQLTELVDPFASNIASEAEALRDVNLAIATHSVPGTVLPQQGPQPKPATTLYDWYAEVKRNHGIVPIGPKTLDQAIVVAQRDPNYMSPMSIDNINTSINEIERQAQLDLQTARRLAHVRPIVQGEWSEEAPTFYDSLKAMGIVDGLNVPYAEMASIIASSGAEAQTRALENFELKSELPKIRELRNQLLWSGTEQGMASALALSSLILKLESTPYSGLVDLETNLPMELLENFLLDPFNFFDLPLGAVANADLARKTAKAMTGLRTLDNADDLAELSKAFRSGLKPWLDGGRVGEIVYPASIPADLLKVLPTAKDMRQPGNFFARQLARTPETQVHISTNNLWVSMANILHGVDNADDAIRLLRTLSDAPQEMIKGVTGLTSPAFVRIADGDGVVRWGAGVVSNPTLVREMPVFQAGTAKVLERMEKARDAAMEAAKKAGTRYDGTQQRVNPLELMVNLHAEWEKAARQMRGIVPLDPPTGATKLNLHDLADGTAQVEWLDDTDKVIKQMPAQPVEAARAQLATMQDALKTATENPLHKGLRVSAEIQRHIMSDMWLNLRPAHWVRNAAAFTLALNADGLYSFKSIPEIFSDMGQKVIAGRANYRMAEGSSGAGAMGETSGTSWMRKGWPKYNPFAWATEKGAKAWTGYGQILNSIPVAEQAAYAHALDRGFTRIFGNEWATAAKQELGPLIQSWNVDPTVAKAILDKIVETGNIGSKADVAQVARQITHGAAEPFSLQNLKIPHEVINDAEAHKKIVRIVDTMGRTTPGQAPETVQQAIQRASDEIKAVFQRLRETPGKMLNEAMPQPTGEQVFNAVDEAAQYVDDALADAGRAGITDPAQLAIVEEEAQQYAQRLIQGETVGWEGVLDELANAPDNPAGMAATFDLLSQVYELKRMARQEVDELMQPIRAAKTPEQRNAAWAAKFQGTRDIYNQLANDLQAVFEENKDILRRIAAGEEVPQQRDWWDVIARYLDFDETKNLQTRSQEFGDMMQEDPATVQKFIDANRAYVDSSYIQLYDIFRRYPSMDGLDVLRMAQKQLDAEGARASAYLATQRARLKHYDEATKRMVGDLDKEDYYVIRNETWRAMFDNQVIFNQAAARAIAAHALAMDAPTQLTWTDDFFGGTFQLIGPAANDQIARAISLTIDDIFEAGAFDPATGKIADKYLAPKPIERIQQGKPKKGKGKAVWTITPEETETYFKALAVAGVTEKRADGWYLLILNEDAAQQAIAERGKFAWLARNVETGQLEVFGSPNQMAPLSEGGSSARVPADVMDDFGALVEGRPFAAAPSPAAAPPAGGMTLPPDGSGGTFPPEAPFVDTGKPGRPYTPPDAATPETPGPAPTPGAPDVTVAPENVVPAPLPVQNLDDLPVVDSYSRPWPTVPQEVLDAKAVQSSPALWEEAVDAEIAKATPVEERPADVIPEVLPPGMTPQEYGDRRATLDALQQADEAERNIAQEIVIDPDAGGVAAAPEPTPVAPVAPPAPAPQAAPAPPVTVDLLNQLAAGARIGTSKADGSPTYQHLINAINKAARDNNAGWQLPTRTIVNSKGKPIQVTSAADFRAWVTAQPEQAQQAAEWLAVKVENAAKLAAEPKPAAATKVAKQPKPKKGKAAAAQPAPAPAYMPDAAQDVDFMAPLPKTIQQRMGAEGNAYMEARRSLPPGGSGGGYPAEAPFVDTGKPGRPYTPPAAEPGRLPVGGSGGGYPAEAPFVDTGKPGRPYTPAPAAAPSPVGAQPEQAAGVADAAIRREINLGGFYQDKSTTNSVKVVPAINFVRYNPLYNVEVTSAAGIRRNLLDTPVSMQEAQDAAVRHAAAGFPETVQPAAAAPAPQAVAPSTRTVVTEGDTNRQTADAADLAADYKARGLERHVAWDEFLKDRTLRPEMNAKEFYALFDAAAPRRLIGKREAVAFTPTHRMQFEEGGPSQLVMVTQDADGLTRTVTETGSRGSIPPGMPLPDYYKPLQPAPSPAPATPGPNAITVTAPVIDTPVRQVELGELEGLPLATGEPITPAPAVPSVPQNREQFVAMATRYDDEIEELDRQRYIYGQLTPAEYDQRLEDIEAQRGDTFLALGLNVDDDPTEAAARAFPDWEKMLAPFGEQARVLFRDSMGLGEWRTTNVVDEAFPDAVIVDGRQWSGGGNINGSNVREDLIDAISEYRGDPTQIAADHIGDLLYRAILDDVITPESAKAFWPGMTKDADEVIARRAVEMAEDAEYKAGVQAGAQAPIQNIDALQAELDKVRNTYRLTVEENGRLLDAVKNSTGKKKAGNISIQQSYKTDALEPIHARMKELEKQLAQAQASDEAITAKVQAERAKVVAAQPSPAAAPTPALTAPIPASLPFNDFAMQQRAYIKQKYPSADADVINNQMLDWRNKWRDAVEASAQTQPIPESVIDSYIREFGEATFNSRFRGANEFVGFELPRVRSETIRSEAIRAGAAFFEPNPGDIADKMRIGKLRKNLDGLQEFSIDAGKYKAMKRKRYVEEEFLAGTPLSEVEWTGPKGAKNKVWKIGANTVNDAQVEYYRFLEQQRAALLAKQDAGKTYTTAAAINAQYVPPPIKAAQTAAPAAPFRLQVGEPVVVKNGKRTTGVFEGRSADGRMVHVGYLDGSDQWLADSSVDAATGTPEYTKWQLSKYQIGESIEVTIPWNNKKQVVTVEEIRDGKLWYRPQGTNELTSVSPEERLARKVDALPGALAQPATPSPAATTPAPELATFDLDAATQKAQSDLLEFVRVNEERFKQTLPDTPETATIKQEIVAAEIEFRKHVAQQEEMHTAFERATDPKRAEELRKAWYEYSHTVTKAAADALSEKKFELTSILDGMARSEKAAKWRAMSPRERLLDELQYAAGTSGKAADSAWSSFNIKDAVKRMEDNPDLPVIELTVNVPMTTGTKTKPATQNIGADKLNTAEQTAMRAQLENAARILERNEASVVVIKYGKSQMAFATPEQARSLAKTVGSAPSASIPGYTAPSVRSGGFGAMITNTERDAFEVWENAIPMQGRAMAPNTAILENVAAKYPLGKIPGGGTAKANEMLVVELSNGRTVYTDGHALYFSKPKDWDRTATAVKRTNLAGSVKTLTDEAQYYLDFEPLGIVRVNGDAGTAIPGIAFGTDDGKIKIMDARFYGEVVRQADGKRIVWKTTEQKKGALAAFVNRELIAVVSPLRMDTPNTSVKDMVKYFYPTTTPPITMYGGFGAVDPIPAMTDIYNTLIKYWRKPKQPEIGDVALHQVTSLNDAEDRILAALPRMAQPKRNNLTAAQANALIDAIDKRLLPAFDDAVSRATYGAERMADTAMLNYRDRRGIDANLALILPYHYFYTRGGATWLRRIARKPSTANMYYDLQKAIETENAQSGVPARFKGTIPLWSYPGGQIRMANPMNSMLPWYMYMPEPFQQQEGDSDAEKMWTAIRSMTPGMMPVFDVAAAALFDQIDPLPDGASRVARYTNLRNYVPLAGMFADAALATTGTVFPAWMGGDPFDPYRIKTAASFMAQEGAISAEVAKYVIQLSLNLQRPGTDAWANIPDDQAAAVSAAYLAAGQRGGRDKLGMGGGLGYFAGVNFYNMPDSERELRSAQDLWRYVGYGEGNPAGSATQRQAVMAQTPALGAFMARTTQPGSPYQPGQQAQAGALYDQLDPLYAQQAAVEDKLITQSGGGVAGGALYDATAKIRQEADALRAKYPDIPESTGRFLSGSNPAEMAEKLIRLAVPKGGPTYPAEGASKAEMAAYYDARSAWEKEQLATFTRNLTTMMAGSDPMQDEINFELFGLTAGKDPATLLREYGAGYYDSNVKRAYDTRNDVKNKAEAAKYDAAEALILQQFGPAGLDTYKTYSVTEDADKQAYKAAHPELKALNFAAYNPNEYGQALALFGKDAILAWAKLPPSDGSEAASKARGEYYDANPGAYLMNAWMNGRPTPYGETRGPWASLPEEWGMEYQNNYGKDFAEAAKKFGDDIWQIAAGYKRGWTSKEKAAYFDKYPALGDFFDWWNELLPDDGKSSSKGYSKGYSSYKKYYKNYSRRSYGRRSYGGYSRGYSGGGGWGSAQWAKEEKPPYMPDVYARDFDRNLWRTDSALRRWEPARAGDNEAERWRPARYGRASGY